ncbi:MAG: hypothetical protein R3C02_23145 [Planctomycetaceae bacterium]
MNTLLHINSRDRPDLRTQDEAHREATLTVGSHPCPCIRQRPVDGLYARS